jgi:hypothetical protein
MPSHGRNLSGRAPRTDGRGYPTHLHAYEEFDDRMLEATASLRAPFTFDDLAAAVGADLRLRDALPRWLASAEWRKLIRREEPALRSPRAYVLTDAGRERLRGLQSAHTA